MLKYFVSAQNTLAQRLRSDRGATAVEYGLLVALIAAVIIGIVIVVGQQVSNAFNSVSSNM
jgi:pilus assembly protein Flp/PilA